MNKDYVAIAKQYAVDVTTGKQAANQMINLVCQRFLDDLDGHDDYYLDNGAVFRACAFIEMMPHTKGKWAQKSMRATLEPWQIFFVANIFGWKRKKDDLRRYRRALLWVPRKNGKSFLASAIGLYMLCADGEYGPEVQSGATNEKQAWEVFRPAKQMAQKLDQLRQATNMKVNAKSLVTLEDGGRFEPIIGKPKDGASPSCGIIDEYHEHPDDKLLDSIETGMGAREQPLLLMITTAGDNLEGPCYQMQIDAERILTGKAQDDVTFPMIFGIDSSDDWKTVEALKKANPNFGISISEDFLTARLNDALNNARKQTTYLTKHLNVWVGAREAYFNLDRWRTSPLVNIEEYQGRECYLGVDLASKVDLASVTILIPEADGTYATFAKYYTPEEIVMERESYQGWDKDGWLTVTEGEIIDFTKIKDDILEICTKFEVKEMAYDPFQATMLITELMNEGVPVVEVGATVRNFSDPMKTMDGLIRARKIKHDGNPITTWNIGNVVAKEDAKENVFPRKLRPDDKIDGAVSLIMALNRAIVGNEQSYNFDDILSNVVRIGF